LIAQFNNIASVTKLIEIHREEIAAIIVEPVAGNMGLVLPEGNFLQDLRSLATQHGIVLIFDEVMTGFRVAPGGAQDRFGVQPDLTTLGKIIGGGLPVGAYGGKKEIMEMVAPLGPVYQAGTLSGNPLAMRAGLETLRLLNQPGFYAGLERKTARLEAGVRENMQRLGIELSLARCGSMGCIFFNPEKVTDYETALKSNTEQYALYFRTLLENGVYAAPSQFETFFISAAHSEADIHKTVEANYKALERVVSQ
jgi:glutamate-1-semialdehyde 2,1-aminomutase